MICSNIYETLLILKKPNMSYIIQAWHKLVLGAGRWGCGQERGRGQKNAKKKKAKFHDIYHRSVCALFWLGNFWILISKIYLWRLISSFRSLWFIIAISDFRFSFLKQGINCLHFSLSSDSWNSGNDWTKSFLIIMSCSYKAKGSHF